MTHTTLPEGDRWLKIGEAAELARVSKDTIRRWESRGILPGFRSPTNLRRYRESDVRAAAVRPAGDVA